MFGWKILFMKPILGDLNGYWSGSSTWIFQIPPANGARAPTFVSVNTGESRIQGRLTLAGTIEPDVELLHAIIYQRDFIIRHQSDSMKS